MFEIKTLTKKIPNIDDQQKSMNSIQQISYLAAPFFGLATNIIYMIVNASKLTDNNLTATNLQIFIASIIFYIALSKGSIKAKNFLFLSVLSSMEVSFVPWYICANLYHNNPFQPSETIYLITFCAVYFIIAYYRHLMIQHWKVELIVQQVEAETK